MSNAAGGREVVRARNLGGDLAGAEATTDLPPFSHGTWQGNGPFKGRTAQTFQPGPLKGHLGALGSHAQVGESDHAMSFVRPISQLFKAELLTFWFFPFWSIFSRGPKR